MLATSAFPCCNSAFPCCNFCLSLLQLLPFLAGSFCLSLLQLLPFLAGSFCLSLLQCHIDMHVAQSGSCFRFPRYESVTRYAAFQILQEDSMNHVFKGFVAFFLLAFLFAWLPQ